MLLILSKANHPNFVCHTVLGLNRLTKVQVMNMSVLHHTDTGTIINYSNISIILNTVK